MSYDREQALEMARCAYVNLHNLADTVPGIKRHPLFALTRMQLREAIGHLGDGDFCEVEDSQHVS